MVIAFPDVDGYDTWVQKADERPHLDIADLLIGWMQERKDDLPEDVSEPLPDTPVSENPVFLEVRKYISPEFHAEVLALIEELGLEVVGMTERIENE